ncbi:GlcG/HbpS family heme-binding protein [Pediococcus claussenii]|uniref:Propanediol utilization protein PduObis n=1 Tax=Pediococcus claussenii (strain ATCC BAA-344 / DSM 14800 / JCM 18046 / KCTC 3811 / LMG 21948 / P06) TaxID=701521 RepID=G8PEI8_PEDCP|nr:heme-binding protein [Pediococcus claussenii]AEV95597.1 Propanediol utilization protein PduObis [Pediococcus claussenii ATCC BAA-344]ANZ69118.1 cobalamin adenosyltransferase [Pediococcus claussenii]ANZ70935.1 cobalamin adenosyltransferase [Pediococcus claussenii]KRN20170.1 pduObis protein [Pediococcus claussenii]
MNEEQINQIVQSILSKDSSVDSNLFDRHKMEKVIDAAVQKADEIGVGVTICIMSEATVVQMLFHMPNANLVSSELAPKKAWSAIAMKEPTKEISKDIQPGAPLYQMETMLDGKLVSFPGGIPLELGGKIIGAIGVSGGLIEEDQAICEKAVETFIKETK